MNVKIVTDSTADIPEEIARDLEITVVPIYVLFGNQSYLDGIDMDREGFYDKLLNGPVHPTTSQPTPQDFASVYERLAPGADGIVSIHLSARLSGTISSATQAAGRKYSCPVEVIDTNLVSIALGIIVIKAARLAKEGYDFETIVAQTRSMVERTRILVLFDTLKYLAKGGRVGKAKSLVGSVLNVKPMLTLKEGEFVPVGQVRNRSKGIEKLLDFARNAGELEDVCVLHSTTPDEAESLAEKLDPVFPRARIIIGRLGGGLATHGGPGVLAVVTLTKEKQAS